MDEVTEVAEAPRWSVYDEKGKWLKTKLIRTQRGACKTGWKEEALERREECDSEDGCGSFREEELVNTSDVTEKSNWARTQRSPLDIAPKRTLVLFGRAGSVEGSGREPDDESAKTG